MRTLLISAAEPSGDRLAAELVQALRSQGPVRARGIAGPKMREAGVEAVAYMEDVCAMGIVEVLSRLGPIRRAQAAMDACIRSGGDALVLVDAPDLHLPMARLARAQAIPTIGYVSPQVWAWHLGLHNIFALSTKPPPSMHKTNLRHNLSEQSHLLGNGMHQKGAYLLR